MRTVQQNRYAPRGRSNNNGRKGQHALSRNYESNGPDVKVRGTAQHIAEKYAALARDALSTGDRVMAENYLQHAEHYNRLVFAALAASTVTPTVTNDSVNEEQEISSSAIIEQPIETASEKSDNATIDNSKAEDENPTDKSSTSEDRSAADKRLKRLRRPRRASNKDATSDNIRASNSADKEENTDSSISDSSNDTGSKEKNSADNTTAENTTVEKRSTADKVEREDKNSNEVISPSGTSSDNNAA